MRSAVTTGLIRTMLSGIGVAPPPDSAALPVALIFAGARAPFAGSQSAPFASEDSLPRRISKAARGWAERVFWTSFCSASNSA